MSVLAGVKNGADIIGNNIRQNSIMNTIVNVLCEANKVAILPHISSDGDSWGSSLALALALERMGKAVVIIAEEEIPENLIFLPGKHLVDIIPSKWEKEVYDVIVSVDTADINMLGKRGVTYLDASMTINIDHHKTNPRYGRINYVQGNAAAAGELVYNLLDMLLPKIGIDMATCIYIAILTDTDGFRYGNTTSRTYEIIAKLINIGVDSENLNRQIFENRTNAKMILIGEAIKSLEFYNSGKVTFNIITDEMMQRAGTTDDECDNEVVNLGRGIKGVEITVMLKQKINGEIKCSLRSCSNFDVSSLARIYSGGGHQKSAGFRFTGDIEILKKSILENITKMLKLSQEEIFNSNGKSINVIECSNGIAVVTIKK